MDRDWIEAGTRRHAEYPAVPSGTLRFEVQASLDGESWGQSATLPVVDPVNLRPDSDYAKDEQTALLYEFKADLVTYLNGRNIASIAPLLNAGA